MSKTAGYLKAAWTRRLLETLLPLLPAGSNVAIWFGGRLLASAVEGGADLAEEAPGVSSFPLLLEGRKLGSVLLQLAGADAASAAAWGAFLVHDLQGMIEAQHARYSVAQETLENYREMALLQRAVGELNQSLKPAAVAATLLKEFEGRKGAADFGAVFLRDADDGSYSTIGSFGERAEAICAKLLVSRLFAAMAEHPQGDIINDLTTTEEVIEFQSLLWLPLRVHGEQFGLLVLATNRPEGFAAADMKRAQTLVSVASSALRNAQLYAAEQVMFQSFVRVIATAIDAKSPYTAGHCRRVPEIALLLAEKAHQAEHGVCAGFRLDEDERNALEIAAMLHDCGKVVTPEWVVDKSTKLDSISNRLDLIAMRFEVLRRDALVEYYRAGAPEQGAAAQAYQARLRELDADYALLQKCNSGSEFVSPEHIARIKEIAKMHWRNTSGAEFPLLEENEVYNLCVQRGTLNPEERKIIEDHAIHTIRMLSQIPFPRSLRNVPEYAGGHHERMDGRGYPRGLKRDQLSIPARIIAIADIFEALTAPDRPYRKGGTLSWAIDVMHRMKQDGHIDGELFDLFLSEGVHTTYTEKHLAAEQCDQVDIQRYLG